MGLQLSRRIGRFRLDRRVVALLVLLGLALSARIWLEEHPQNNPWAPLDLRDPAGWATARKLHALRGDPELCQAVLRRSDVAFDALAPVGEGACRQERPVRLSGYPLSPDTPGTSCPVAVALTLWQRDALGPAALEIFGQEVAGIEHLGAYSCRRMYGRSEGRSEHATANAIDIGGFVLQDGTRISVLEDWDGDADKARFLERIRDGACTSFATVLSPDYNAAHADHLHLDMSDGWSGLCR